MPTYSASACYWEAAAEPATLKNLGKSTAVYLTARGGATGFEKSEPQLQPETEPQSPSTCPANRDAGSALAGKAGKVSMQLDI